MALITWSRTEENKTTVDGQGGATIISTSVDWSNVLNTPSTLAGYGITDAYTKTESDANYAAAIHTHAWSDITSGKPTTLAGYGITDAYTKTESDAAFLAVGAWNENQYLTGTTVYHHLEIVNGRIDGVGTRNMLLSDFGGIGGSITAGQVAFGAATANEIEGASTFTYSASKLKIEAAVGNGFATIAGLVIDVYSTTAGDDVKFEAVQATTSGSGHAYYYAEVDGGSSGHPYMRFAIDGVRSYAWGIKNTVAGDPMVLTYLVSSNLATPLSTAIMTVDSSGNVIFTGTVTTTGLDLGGTSTQFVKADGSLDSTVYNSTIGTDTNISYSGATVINTIAITDGVITSHSSRSMALSDLGYTGATDADNYASWTIQDGGAITDTIASGNTLKITAGTGITSVLVDSTGPIYELRITNSSPNVATDLSKTVAATITTIHSSDGTDVILSAATASLSGLVTTGAQSWAGVKTYTSFPVTPAAAPTTDYQVANKKYVDDNVGGGGNVSNTGTPVDNQVAVWTSATVIEGNANFIWNGSYSEITANSATIRLGGNIVRTLTSSTTADVYFQAKTTAITGSGHAYFEASHGGGTSGGDPFFRVVVADTPRSWAIGMNASSLNSLYFGTAATAVATPFSGVALTLTTAGAGTFVSSVTASSFSGAGTGLTGTAVSLTVGAVTVSNSTSATWYPLVWHNNSNQLYDTNASMLVQASTGSIRANRHYLAGTTFYLRDITGTYGTVQAEGVSSTYAGFSVQGTLVLMSNGTTTAARGGLYNDLDDRWIIQAGNSTSSILPAAVGLYYTSLVKLQTSSAGVTVTGEVTASNVTATSDRRLKTNIIYGESWLTRVLAISKKVVRYDWLDENEKKVKDNIGMIAQDIQKIAPEFVGTWIKTVEKYDGAEVVSSVSKEYYNLNYEKMVTPLYSAFGEHYKEFKLVQKGVVRIHSEVNTLKNKVKNLQKEVKQLKQIINGINN